MFTEKIWFVGGDAIECFGSVSFGTDTGGEWPLNEIAAFCKCTYDSLWQTDIVGWCNGRRLIWAARIPKDGQLLDTSNTTFAQTTCLYPIRSNWLISIDYEIVSLTYILYGGKNSEIKHIRTYVRRWIWTMRIPFRLIWRRWKGATEIIKTETKWERTIKTGELIKLNAQFGAMWKWPNAVNDLDIRWALVAEYKINLCTLSQSNACFFFINSAHKSRGLRPKWATHTRTHKRAETWTREKKKKTLLQAITGRSQIYWNAQWNLIWTN